MWANIKMVDSGLTQAVNFDEVEWKTKSESILLSRSYDHDVLIAKEKESQNLIDNEVYDVVTDEGQDYVESRWVLTEKVHESGQKTVKARLVAKGFQDQSDVRTDSPTCDKSSVRLIFTLAATNHWKVCSLDIKAAFLQGRQIQRELYMKPPREFGSGILWKLNKAMYGTMHGSHNCSNLVVTPEFPTDLYSQMVI